MKEDYMKMENSILTNGRAKLLFEDIAENPTGKQRNSLTIFNTGRGTVGQWHTQVRSREIDDTTNLQKENLIFI